VPIHPTSATKEERMQAWKPHWKAMRWKIDRSWLWPRKRGVPWGQTPRGPWEEALLLGREPRERAKGRPSQESLGAALAGASEPMADGDLGGTQGRSDVSFTPSLPLQLQHP